MLGLWGRLDLDVSVISEIVDALDTEIALFPVDAPDLISLIDVLIAAGALGVVIGVVKPSCVVPMDAVAHLRSVDSGGDILVPPCLGSAR